MNLLYVYVASLVAGGVLLGASLFLGHDDHDADGADDGDGAFDGEAVAEGEAAAAGGSADDHGDAADLWMPFLSLRFWVFFLFFFGLAGALLQLFELASSLRALITALTIGLVCGFGAAFALRRLRRGDVSSGISDYRGLEGKVLLGLHKGESGKVRLLAASGEQVDMLAQTDEPEPIARGERVLVIGTTANGVRVVRHPE